MSAPTATQLDAARRATEPTGAEVDGLLRALREQPQRRFRLDLRIALAAAAAALVVGLLLHEPHYGDAPAPGARVELAEVGALRLGPSISLTGDASLIVTSASHRGTVVTLTEGTVQAEVDPSGAWRSFAVRAPQEVTVRVVGTVFSVSWDAEEGRGAVAVERGRVAVEGPEGDRAVAAGERWTWGGPEAVPQVAPGPAAEEAPEVVEPEVVEPEVEQPEVEGPRIEAPQVARIPPAPAPQATPEPEPLAVVDPMEPADEPAPTTAEAAPRDYSDHLAFNRVDQATGPERLALAEAFLARYPDSALAPSVEAIRVEALAGERPEEALQRAEAWLVAHPNHPDRRLLLSLAAPIARDDLQDCGRALPWYRELVRMHEGGAEATNLSWAALCAAELQDPEAGALLDAALAHPQSPRALRPALKQARRALASER